MRALEKIPAGVANWRLESAGAEGFAVAVRQGRDIAHFRPDGTSSHWVMVLPGTGHQLRFDTPQGLPRLVGADRVSSLPGVVVRADGGLRVLLPGEGKWTLDAHRAVRDYQRAADSGPDPAQRLLRQLSDWSHTPGEPALEDWRNSLEAIEATHDITKQHEMERILGIANASLPKQMTSLPPAFLWRVRIAAFLTSQKIRNWRIETASDHHLFHVVFGMGTALTFQEGQLVGWRVDLPGSDLQVHYDERRPVRSVQLETRNGGRAPDGWKPQEEEGGRVTVVQDPAAGEEGPWWRVSAGGTLESFTGGTLESFRLPPANPADPGAFARLPRAGMLDHPVPLASPGARLGVGPGRPSLRPSDTGSGSRTPGPSRAGPSVPARPAPPAPSDMSDGDRTKEITRELLTQVNDKKSKLARLLLTHISNLKLLLAGGGDKGVWLPRLRVLREIAEKEADWRLESAGAEGFAVAVRQSGSIAHFRPDGALSHWRLTLPGHGHQLRFDTPQGLPRLVSADGVSSLPGVVVRADGGLRVLLPGEGEWTLDAHRAVRDYQRAADSGPDPAQRLLRQLSDWSHTPGKLALWDRENSLETLKKAHGITVEYEMARLLGIHPTRLTASGRDPSPGFLWRARIAAFLTAQDIRNWRIETDLDRQLFHVVFGMGTALTFQEGQLVGWRVDLPGSDLQVHYDERRPVRSVQLETRNGGRAPDGWKPQEEEGGRVTVVQDPAAGEEGPWWRVSAGGTLESFRLPPAYPADPGVFARLPQPGALNHPAPHPEPVPELESFTLPPANPADPSVFARLPQPGVLNHPAPHPEPVPEGAAPMALDSGLPGGALPGVGFPDMDFDRGLPAMGFPDLEMPDTVAEDEAGPSYLHTLNWTDT